MPTRTIREPHELAAIAGEVLSTLPQKDAAQVIALRGELGAGKTTFVQLLGEALGVREHITSPTFVVMKRYTLEAGSPFRALVHIDAYRIEDKEELRVLKIGEVLKEKGTLVCIEWPERISEFVPDDAFLITMTLHEDETRTISYGD